MLPAKRFPKSDLEEDPYPKLYIPWRVVREESTKVRIVHLSRAVEFQPLNRPDVKRVGISAGKTLRYASAKETERQGANCLTRRNRQPNAIEDAINLGQGGRLTWIRSVPGIDFSLRDSGVAWQPAKPERRVAGVVVSESRMIERIDQIHSEVDLASSFGADKGQVEALLNRNVEKLLHWSSYVEGAG